MDARPTFLVVDADQSRRDALVPQLEGRGRVILAMNGFEALRRLVEVSPQVVFCAAALPGFVGDGLARIIKAKAPRAKVIMIAAPTRDARALGCDVALSDRPRPHELAPLLDAWGFTLASDGFAPLVSQLPSAAELQGVEDVDPALISQDG